MHLFTSASLHKEKETQKKTENEKHFSKTMIASRSWKFFLWKQRLLTSFSKRKNKRYSTNLSYFSKKTFYSQNNYKTLTHYALKTISVFRNRVLINSAAFVLISFLLSRFIFYSAFFLLVLSTLLIFNIIIFLLANQINKSHIVKNTLTNVENEEN